MYDINWDREDRRIVLPISILAPSPVSDLTAVRANALLDTGSTTSGVAQAIAAKLRLPHLGKRPLGSVHGEAQTDRYLFRIGLNIPGSPLPFIFDEVIGFELKNASSFDALLGMDVLRRCDFSMNRRGACRLSFG
jgi:hypothetical protein